MNVTKSDDNDSDSCSFLFSITPSICYLNASEWMLDSEAVYHVCPRREWFSSVEKLDEGVVIMGNDHAC